MPLVTPPVTLRLAQFAAEIDYSKLAPEVLERAGRLVLDHVGIALRARHEAELNRACLNALERLGLAYGNTTVIGDRDGFAPAAAAFYNGNLAHSLDFDDTHARGSIHPGAPIIPAAFAAAEMVGADGKTLLSAIIAGYEVQIRLSLALNPTEHYRQGFHPTATCGVFGAAAAAGRVLGLSPETMANAYGLCGSQAAGSMQFLLDGAWNKPFHTGYAAMGGLMSATFAAEGFRGAAQAIEGDSGFLHAYAPNADPHAAVAGLGETWETMAVAVKPYPSCRYGHAAMDALIALRDEHGLGFEDVESVEVALPKTGIRLVGEPQQEKQRPTNYVDGQFSMPFVAAVAIREGAMGWDDYAKHLADPDTLALCQRITTTTDPQIEAEFPAHMGGLARIKTRGGQWLEKAVFVAKGEPENFLTDAEMQTKFDKLVEPYLDHGPRQTLASTLVDLAPVPDIRTVLPLTRPAKEGLMMATGGAD